MRPPVDRDVWPVGRRPRAAIVLALLAAACPEPAGDDSGGDGPAGDDSGEGEPDDDSGDDDSAVPLTPQQQRGRDLYLGFCSYCHGDAGQGYAADEAPALACPTFLETATDSFLEAAVVHGRPGTTMSAWGWDYGGPLVPQDVTDMVAFFRSWRRGPRLDVHDLLVPGQPEEGEDAYSVNCADCHGPDGSGGAGTALANPWLLHTASNGFLLHAIARGRPGTQMAAWDGMIAGDTIADVVALIRSWKTPVEDTKVPPFEPDLAHPVTNPGGPPADFSGSLIDGMYVPLADVWAAWDSGQAMVLLDSRPGSDYLAGHITGAISTAFYRVAEAIPWLPEDLWLVAYCGCPHSLSGEVVLALRDAGFERTAVLDEGWYGWVAAGHPVTAGPQQW